MFLDKKTAVLKIWLNLGLNLTIFSGTGGCNLRVGRTLLIWQQCEGDETLLWPTRATDSYRYNNVDQRLIMQKLAQQSPVSCPHWLTPF